MVHVSACCLGLSASVAQPLPAAQRNRQSLATSSPLSARPPFHDRRRGSAAGQASWRSARNLQGIPLLPSFPADKPASPAHAGALGRNARAWWAGCLGLASKRPKACQQVSAYKGGKENGTPGQTRGCSWPSGSKRRECDGKMAESRVFFLPACLQGKPPAAREAAWPSLTPTSQRHAGCRRCRRRPAQSGRRAVIPARGPARQSAHAGRTAAARAIAGAPAH